MTESDIKSIILKDYRKIIIKHAVDNNWWYRDCNKKRRYWKDDKEKWACWDNWNILQQTLEFELSPARHVEEYEFVKRDNDIDNKMYKKYCEMYDKYKTSDLMNGWWYCFKLLFNIKNRKDYKAINEVLDIVKGKDERSAIDTLVNNKYSFDKKTISSFFTYMKVVYTVGNITPAPNNRRADNYDSWEYKLNKYGKLFEDVNSDYINDLHFEEYDPIYNIENKEQYMESRVDKIIKRGLKILGYDNDDYLKKVKQQITMNLNEG